MFSKCRSVDADGPLARLKKALFNPVLYSSIREWIIEYWNGFFNFCGALFEIFSRELKLKKSVLKVGGVTDGTCISNAYGGIYKDLFNSYC